MSTFFPLRLFSSVSSTLSLSRISWFFVGVGTASIGFNIWMMKEEQESFQRLENTLHRMHSETLIGYEEVKERVRKLEEMNK